MLTLRNVIQQYPLEVRKLFFVCPFPLPFEILSIFHRTVSWTPELKLVTMIS
uniref:Uncharacterized protein n=1 Tax=Arundo donax TaxID=35708 RepID=A0A0A9HHS7_ARUDO